MKYIVEALSGPNPIFTEYCTRLPHPVLCMCRQCILLWITVKCRQFWWCSVYVLQPGHLAQHNVFCDDNHTYSTLHNTFSFSIKRHLNTSFSSTEELQCRMKNLMLNAGLLGENIFYRPTQKSILKTGLPRDHDYNLRQVTLRKSVAFFVYCKLLFMHCILMCHS